MPQDSVSSAVTTANTEYSHLNVDLTRACASFLTPTAAVFGLHRGGIVVVHVSFSSMRHVRLHVSINVRSGPIAAALCSVSPSLLFLASAHGNSLLVTVKQHSDGWGGKQVPRKQRKRKRGTTENVQGEDGTVGLKEGDDGNKKL